LARGAVAMSQKKVIVKRLNSIQNFGAIDVLCSDKTGTLTQDKVVLERHLDIHGAECEKALQYAYLNSFYQTGLKNLLDVAVLEHAGLRTSFRVGTDLRLVDEIPFDFGRRRMSVVVESERRCHLVITKGAVEEMLKICTTAELKGQRLPLGDDLREQAVQMTRALNEDGLRVIAVAFREFTAHRETYSIADESAMTLLGFIAFLDPPKETAAEAIRALKEHGVRVKILTGDNEVITRRVCCDVGLDASEILLGSQVEELDAENLKRFAENTTVFAKVSPTQKARIIHALKTGGHVVGFLGDGINDAAALREADIGISVNTAVDIAKESADIILLEKSLLVLEEGVLEGRRTFGNIFKYIRMGTSSNFGNVFSVLGASAWLPFLPMLPLQLLVQNLLYDVSQTAIPFDNVDDDFLSQPRKWKVGSIARFMVFIGPVSSIFDYATFCLMWFLFETKAPEHQSLFQSACFVEGLLSQTLVVHVIRTAKIPFIQSRASWALTLLTSAIMAIGLAIPFTRFGLDLGLTPLPGAYFLWLLLILATYCALAQQVKGWFARRYGYY
ncbi:MAG: magnesium-translocating P-type ATPase, partial [Candidatus Acidiferrales bacterium]